MVIDCNRTNNLNIYTLHEKLKNLQVSNFSYDFFEETEVEIYAPNLLKLEFSDSMPRKRYCVRSTSSQTNVTLNFEGMFDVEYDEESDYDWILLGLLHSISDAKEITLCSWCIQVGISSPSSQC